MDPPKNITGRCVALSNAAKEAFWWGNPRDTYTILKRLQLFLNDEVFKKGTEKNGTKRLNRTSSGPHG